MGWVSPTGYTDPNNEWSDETSAYDGNLGTYAIGQYGTTAQLGLEPGDYITTYKIRIYCQTGLGEDIDEIEVYSLIDGSIPWIHYTGPVPALTWFEIEFNSLISTNRIYVRKQTIGSWRLHELEFWDGADGYQLLASEDYIVDNNNVIINALSSPMQRKIVVGPGSRIHCTFRKCTYGGRYSHVYYAYSDDYGKTWTIEDPTPGLHADSQHSPSIAVDSSGNPHIVFRDQPDTIHGKVHTGRYVRRSADGTWTRSNFYLGAYVTKGGGPTPPPFNFTAGDQVKGGTSGVTKTIVFVFTLGASSKILCFIGNSSGLIEGEPLNNLDQAGNQCWYGYDMGPSAGTAIVIDSSNRLRIVGATTYLWYWLQYTPNSTIGHSQGTIGSGQSITIDIDSSNTIKTVYIDGLSYHDGLDDTLICTGTSSVPTYLSVAADAAGNVHLVLAQTGLGGDFPTVLNIKYYRRIGLSWSGPIHITDVDYEQRFSSISIDTQGRIHVMWQGKGWGTYPGKYSVLLRTYEEGAWGAVQVILNDTKDQGVYGPSLLHAWHPNSNRLKDPVYILARQGSWKLQFGGTLPVAIPPDNLLCEQTKNPTNVSDPQPEFSAVYW